MELHNDQVPGTEVWAVLVIGNGTYEQHRYVNWFITSEASNLEYRHMVEFHKASRYGGAVQRWKVLLPKRGMSAEAVTLFVDDQLLLQPGPTEHTRILDVSVQHPKRRG